MNIYIVTLTLDIWGVIYTFENVPNLAVDLYIHLYFTKTVE